MRPNGDPDDSAKTTAHVTTQMKIESVALFYVIAYICLLIIHLYVRRINDTRLEDQQRRYDEMSRKAQTSSLPKSKDNLLDDTTGFQEETPNAFFRRSNIGGQVIKYSLEYSISYAALFHLEGTICGTPGVTKNVLVTYTMALMYFLFETTGTACGWQVPLLNVQALQSMITLFTGLVGILLGFYISTVVSRWWSLRNDTLGHLWGAVNDICLFNGAHFNDKSWRPLRTLVLRYCMSSYELTFMQAQGVDSELWRLVGRGLLTQSEADMLAKLPSRSQVLWTWIAWIFRNLYDKGHIDSMILQLYYQKCAQARGAIGGIFAYLDTQLPISYVQLLAGMVHLLSFVVALEVGIANSRYFMIQHGKLDSSEALEYRPLVKLIQLTLVPLFYNGCLEIGRTLSNPLCDDFQDFPRHAFHSFMLNEAQGFHSTFEVPSEAAQAIIGALPSKK
mmetsp:Transcript_77779/g.137170  ORF Transcript_77779/g.137170 Transcript_77779/m.137170 type:complete len:448 (-) Transcript_77779:25-1368(-)